MTRDKHHPARTRRGRTQLKMSEYEYNNLLYKISKRLDKIHVGEQLLVICRGILPARNEENIPTFSLFKERISKSQSSKCIEGHVNRRRGMGTS